MPMASALVRLTLISGLEQRRLDWPYVLRYRNGTKIGDFRKKWAAAWKATGRAGWCHSDRVRG